MRTGVAIALFNGMRYLKEQIDSLLSQTMLPDNIVCCDDGSTDGTLEWLRAYVSERGESDRFVLVQNDVNLGYAQNFYKALDLCDADIIFLCDQDDIWDKRKIEIMSAHFSSNASLSLMACAHTLIDSAGTPISSMRYEQKTGDVGLRFLSPHEIVTRFNWPGMTMAIRRTFWNQIKSEAKQIHAPHDRVLSLLAASNNGMAFLDTPLCAHRLHSTNNGGEENSMRTYLSRSFKINELSTSISWLDAQIKHSSSFSFEAQTALSGYHEYLLSRLHAVKRRNPFMLLASLRYKEFVNYKGLAADLYSIFFGN